MPEGNLIGALTAPVVVAGVLGVGVRVDTEEEA
jgi:hydroxymethylglutaryl-CoA reductase